MFVDVGGQVSIKWLIFTVLLTASLILILCKVIYDLTQERKPPAPFETPIKCFPEERLFVIKRNENFVNSIVVGCYQEHDEIDRLAYLGVVHLVQDKVIQIKVHTDLGVLAQIPVTTNELKNIVVRPVVPVTALQQFSSSEN